MPTRSRFRCNRNNRRLIAARESPIGAILGAHRPDPTGALPPQTNLPTVCLVVRPSMAHVRPRATPWCGVFARHGSLDRPPGRKSAPGYTYPGMRTGNSAVVSPPPPYEAVT